MKYGVPYKGSKSFIAEKIIAQLPPADVFVDLFAGGCAMTHCALLSGKYRRVIANDIDGSGIRLFTAAVDGVFHDETRWIRREDFFALKDSDPYVKYCWSFGFGGTSYLYSKEIEPYKKALHEMFFEKGVYERKVKYRTVMAELAKYLRTKNKAVEPHNEAHVGLESLQSLERLQSLENLERLQSLENLERLERLQSLENLERLQSLEISFQDYRDVTIPVGAVIYCDPPYKGTSKYVGKGEDFDAEAFREWAGRQKNIYVSEYEMPEEFSVAAEIDHAVRINADACKAVTERLFVPYGCCNLQTRLALI